MIVLASDHAAIELKAAVKGVVERRGLECKDLGPFDQTSVDYPDYAHRVASAVAEGSAGMGILLCGTGIGMSMAANRHQGVRAALCHDGFTAAMARRHNDANVLCIGARVTGAGVAEQIVEIFLDSEFEGGRHGRRVDKIDTSAEER